MPIYRSISPGAYPISEVIPKYVTKRPPGNVPYLVDNLWEWARPKEFPNRRFSVYASPTKKLACASGPENSDVYRVVVNPGGKICQLDEKHSDSKYHPECRCLKRKIIDICGREWQNLPVSDKIEIGRLFIPCLDLEEVEDIFIKSKMLNKYRGIIWGMIKYWNDITLITAGGPPLNEKGEIFFEPENGYTLEPCY